MSLLPAINDLPYKDISDLISSNAAFTNPLRPSITLINASVTSLQTLVNSIGFDTLFPSPPNPLYNPAVGIHASQILIAIDNLNTTLGRFSSHTDNLSGISLSNGLQGANFATITTIVSTVDKYKNDGSVCEVVFGAFGAILKANEFITAINNLIGQIGNILTIPGQIASNLDFLQQLLEEQIESDLIAFANAQIDLLQLSAAAALSSLINNDCIAEILTKVGSQELKTVIATKGRNLF